MNTLTPAPPGATTTTPENVAPRQLHPLRRSRVSSFYDLTFDELRDMLAGRGQPGYRAQQLYEWAYKRLAGDYRDMTVLPAALRASLANELPLDVLTPVREIETDDGDTVKVLYRTADGQTIETVLMYYADRATVCVSCQVGCAVGCSFCATGMGGLQRNLTTGEMVAQVIDMARRARRRGRPLTNIVMMGMGEPFHNYAAVMKMVAILHDARGMQVGARRITLSTSGVVPFIDRLASEPFQVNLAISIHAADDALRSELVPLNRRWPLDELLGAVRRYIRQTGRRVSFEYALIADVNDRDDDAWNLARRLRGLLCHVNLIPLNPTPAAPYQRPSADRIARFERILVEAGIPTTVRYSRGVEIAAACGQLRAQHAPVTAQPPLMGENHG
ncbi:MAG: 23S rRNA (adenine(2503)-C(2))-methyltransferase RlmN [Chloroflexi bacterium]|nr:MAG: 23S rRNA (adenine(2503)-C(2))-methyltransferase RlmN [Chloroflexota bacterium]